EFPFVQHEFTQRADLTCELTIRPIPDAHRPDDEIVRSSLGRLFGDGAAIEVRYDARLGERAAGGKAIPYRSELLLED
ncbi:MAG: hypothetical protein ACRD68_10735, partial [Pyrinomonadaceae bacterium]